MFFLDQAGVPNGSTLEQEQGLGVSLAVGCQAFQCAQQRKVRLLYGHRCVRPMNQCGGLAVELLGRCCLQAVPERRHILRLQGKASCGRVPPKALQEVLGGL